MFYTVHQFKSVSQFILIKIMKNMQKNANINFIYTINIDTLVTHKFLTQ